MLPHIVVDDQLHTNIDEEGLTTGSPKIYKSNIDGLVKSPQDYHEAYEEREEYKNIQ